MPGATRDAGDDEEQGWEHFPHGADIGLRGWGKSCEQAFEQAAVALTAITCDHAAVRPAVVVTLQCQAPSRELLFYEWLNALIFEMATRRMLFSRFRVRFEKDGLVATASGEPVDPARHQPAVEVKGATFTELKVGRNADGVWLAQCVVDV